VDIVKKYHPYYTCATELEGILQPFDLYHLQRINLVNSSDIEDIKDYLDDAVAENKWIIFIAHEFGGYYGDQDDTWYQSDSLLRMVFDEIVARGIPVKTVREVIYDLYPPDCFIECAEDSLQEPVLTYFEEEDDAGEQPFNPSVWNEYWHTTFWTEPRFIGSPVVYCHTSNDSLPVMKFHKNVQNGEYEVIASIIEYNPGRTYRLYYSFDSLNTSKYYVDVDKSSDVSLGTVTVIDGKFTLYTQKAEVVTGEHGFVGWAFIKLISKPLPLDLRVLLEGPFNGSRAMATTLYNQSLIPKYQPFKVTPWKYLGTEVAASLPQNTVDWVLIELRSDYATVVSRRAGLLLADGSVVDNDGSSPLSFVGVPEGNYYVVVRHRNHLAIMSSSPISLSSSLTSYDFTTSQSQAYGEDAMKNLGNELYGMIAGDANQDGYVTSSDFNMFNPSFTNAASGYDHCDWNLDGFVTSTDFNFFNPNFTNAKQSFVP
jgi:hypothetical protein